MGIVNVTPDSFSDGGENLDPRRRGRRRRGGCSPRAPRSSTSAASRPGPGAEAVAARRGAAPRRAGARAARGRCPSRSTPRRPRSRGGRSSWAPCSSTTSPRCAAIRSSPASIADAGAYVCLMHMQGEPRTMQVEPRYDDVVDEVAGVPRGPPRGRGRGRDSRGARLPRPGHRLRQDARPEPRADPRPRADLPDRPPGARRALAQEHAGARARRPDRPTSARTRPRSAPPSRPSIAARRSSAPTMSQPMSRRWPPPRRSSGGASRDDRAPRHRPPRLPRRPRGGAARRPAVPRRRRARPRARAGGTQRRGSRTRSTTARSSPASGRSRTARAYHLLEAFAAAIADALVADLPVTAVRVRVRKPDVVLDPPVEFAAVVGRACERLPSARLSRAGVSPRRLYGRLAHALRRTHREIREPARALVRERQPIRCSRRDRARETVPADDPLATLTVPCFQRPRSTFVSAVTVAVMRRSRGSQTR